MSSRIVLRTLPLVVLVALLAGCDGSGSGAAAAGEPTARQCAAELQALQNATDRFAGKVGQEAFGDVRAENPRCVDRWAVADGVPREGEGDVESLLFVKRSSGWDLLTAGTALGPDARYGIPQDIWDEFFDLGSH